MIDAIQRIERTGMIEMMDVIEMIEMTETGTIVLLVLVFHFARRVAKLTVIGVSRLIANKISSIHRLPVNVCATCIFCDDVKEEVLSVSTIV